MLPKRACGVLLHPTSLPGPGGIGSLGADALRFLDLLQTMGMSYWQLLPLSPPGYGNSPYSALSAFACNPLLIDLEQLYTEGDLSSPPPPGNHHPQRVDFGRVIHEKTALLRQAATNFLRQTTSVRHHEYHRFCSSHTWLQEYALFMTIKRRFGGKAWSHWPEEFTCATPEQRQRLAEQLDNELAIEKYLQWQAFRQWSALRHEANRRGIRLIGDIPIFVAHDSADVWTQRELFLLDANGTPSVVAGVPPDYFSATGQLWGNPLYNWELMEQQGYRWWIERFRSQFELFDLVRVDHFRGFEAAWHIPASASTAQDGRWVRGPVEQFFDTLQQALGTLPIIAEDLGVITPEVVALRERYGFPGMKILQFAFDAAIDDRDLPHNHLPNAVVYTGTHDNDTTNGWYTSRTPAEREEMHAYLGTSGEDGVGDLIRAALMSVADTAIIPLQDLLRLDSEARMNIPGTPSGNWEWRFSWEMIPSELPQTTRQDLHRYGRLATGVYDHAP